MSGGSPVLGFVFATQVALAGSLAPLTAAAEEPPAPDLSKEERIDGLPASMQPWRDPKDPLVENLSEGWDIYYKRRDTSADPKREAGPDRPAALRGGLGHQRLPDVHGAARGTHPGRPRCGQGGRRVRRSALVVPADGRHAVGGEPDAPDPQLRPRQDRARHAPEPGLLPAPDRGRLRKREPEPAPVRAQHGGPGAGAEGDPECRRDPDGDGRGSRDPGGLDHGPGRSLRAEDVRHGPLRRALRHGGSIRKVVGDVHPWGACAAVRTTSEGWLKGARICTTIGIRSPYHSPKLLEVGHARHRRSGTTSCRSSSGTDSRPSGVGSRRS